jgi:serine/threonine protein kinase
MEVERIGKYQILGEIGHGTMGRVYKALDPVLNRHVAIKTLSSAVRPSDESRERFHREAQAAALLSHPNIVTVHDFGEEQSLGLLYMAMELLEGIDLRDAIGTEMLATLDEQLHVMEQVCAGLAFAHSKGVIHRDLKPANIHIQPNNQVKIVDFGLARLGGSEMTQDGIVLGTPNYMSPEQALGDKVDDRSDIFSAGAVFYEILTGRKPFDAESTPGVLYQVVHKQPPRVREYAPDAPMILVEVIERALAKDKNTRFQTAKQMRAALWHVRQAVESGRGGDSLANESQRMHRGPVEPLRKTAPLPPSASRPAWIDGTVALDIKSSPDIVPARPKGSRPDTLSGHARTQGASGRRTVRPPGTARGLVFAGLGVIAIGLAGGAYYWLRGRPAVPRMDEASVDPSKAQVGALTQALVETQVQLALRDLEDKNYEKAIGQAERTLKLAPDNADARHVLEQAKTRRGELEKAARDARSAFEAGDNARASQALSHVLELDPRHPVARELGARLNSVFRSQADEAGRSMARSRADAEASKATAAPGFAQAVALAGQAEALFKKGEFAEATQRYLEARDGFDRTRRAAQPAAKPAAASTPAPVESAAVSAATPLPSVAPPAPPSAPSVESLPSTAPAPVHRFVTGKTVIATAKAGGDVEGFETADVKKQKVPEMAGHLEFETSPDAISAGGPFTVKVYLVNEGKKPLRVKGVTLATIVNGKRTAANGSPPAKDIAPLARTLVGELPGTWPDGVRTWSLEAVVTSDRDETCTGRLNWGT